MNILEKGLDPSQVSWGGLSILFLMALKKGYLKKMLDVLKIILKYDSSKTSDNKQARIRDVKRLIRENAEVIGGAKDQLDDLKNEVKSIIELLNKAISTQDLDRTCFTEQIDELLQNSHKQEITLAIIQTVLDSSMPKSIR